MCKYARGDMHGVDKAQAFLDAAFCDGILDLRSNVNKFLPVLRIEPDVVGE